MSGDNRNLRTVLLAGGVGGARLARGLAAVLAPGARVARSAELGPGVRIGERARVLPRGIMPDS